MLVVDLSQSLTRVPFPACSAEGVSAVRMLHTRKGTTWGEKRRREARICPRETLQHAGPQPHNDLVGSGPSTGEERGGFAWWFYSLVA